MKLITLAHVFLGCLLYENLGAQSAFHKAFEYPVLEKVFQQDGGGVPCTLAATISQQPSPSCGAGATLNAVAVGATQCPGNAYYFRSSFHAPWSQSTNEVSMDTVFGAGNWIQEYYETANAVAVFSGATGFVFMEGGDNNAIEMDSFITANLVLIENWVFAGGRIFLNAAPNEGGSMNWGFGGVMLNYSPPPTWQQIVVQAAPHAVFSGPFLPVATSFSAFFYLHSNVTGPGLTSILNDTLGNSGLSLGIWGNGLTAFGGMTTTNFHTPSLESANLRQNVISYLGIGGNGNNITYVWDNGETTASITVATAGTYCVTITDCQGCTASACFNAVVSNPIVNINQAPNPACGLGPVLTASAGGGSGCGVPYYIRSNLGNVWGTNRNQSEMDTVFGPGNWTEDYFETGNAAAIFSPGTGFVFMEGSDFTALAMDSFVTTNISIIENWVQNGGRLFLNAAPNQGGIMNWGFSGTQLNYIPPGTWQTTVHQATTHPIFTGPYLPMSTSFTGNYYTHSYISGTGLTSIWTDLAGNSGLSYKSWGNGEVWFGGMTTSNWHYPGNEASNFRKNILSYLGGAGGSGYTYSWSTGETTDSIVAATAGNYCVTVTDCNGCSASSCIDVIISNPTVNINQAPNPACGLGPVLTANAGGGVGCGVPYYIRSNLGNVWGNTQNQTEMDAVFGVGNWTQDYFETGNAAAIFSPATSFVFMEGGDFTALALDTFMTTNIALIENWVNTGGRLFVTAAPNVGGIMNWGFSGTQLNYIPPGTWQTTVQQATAHPIFSGPYLPMSTSFTGNYYTHSYISGTGLTSIWTDLAGNSGLSYKSWGTGEVWFGGMTTSNWHYPGNEATNFRKNILSYLGGAGGGGYTYSWNTGETTSSITAPTAGNYCVTVTDCHGCTASSCIDVIISNPTVMIAQSQVQVCGQLPALTANAGGGVGCGVPYYIRSNLGNVWGNTQNQTEMDAAFGLGNWIQDYFETANAAAIFSPGTSFVFMEGGDFTALALDTFMTTNMALIENWVSAGGRLFVTAAPNVGGVMNWGFAGTQLNYIPPGTWQTTVHQAYAHPVFAGPFLPTQTSFTGNYYTHAYITGTGFTSIWTDLAGNSGLSYKTWGTGEVWFGGMTTSNWHYPSTEDGNFRKNILNYLGGAGGGGYTYLWNTGATTISITPNAPGTYCVTATDCQGCTASACTNVINNSMTIALSQVINACGSKAVIASVTGGAPPYTYFWNNGMTASTIIVTASGTYCVTVTDASGCTGSACININIPANPTVNFTWVPTIANCRRLNFTSNVTGGTPPFTYHWTFPGAIPATSTLANPTNITYTNSGTFPVSITISDASGCTASMTQMVQVGQPCDVGLIDFCYRVNQTVSGFQVQIFNVTHGCAGTAGITYSYNGGATWTGSTSFTFNTPGIYTICVKVRCTVCGNVCERYCCKQVQINAPCNIINTATLGTPGVNQASGLVTFTATHVIDAVYDWDFDGNGTWDFTTVISTTTNTYAPGTHTACVRIRLSADCYKVICRTFVVEPLCNVGARMRATFCTNSPLTVDFMSINMNNVSNVSWTFSDGGTATDTLATHTFATYGTYTVCMTVYGAYPNCYLRMCYQIYVGPKNCYPNALPRVAPEVGEETIEEVPIEQIEEEAPSGFGDTDLQGIKVFPNPASTNVTLEFTTEKDQDITLQIFDLNGKELWAESGLFLTGTNQVRIPVIDFPVGLYFVRLTTDDRMESEKFSVNR